MRSVLHLKCESKKGFQKSKSGVQKIWNLAKVRKGSRPKCRTALVWELATCPDDNDNDSAEEDDHHGTCRDVAHIVTFPRLSLFCLRFLLPPEQLPTFSNPTLVLGTHHYLAFASHVQLEELQGGRQRLVWLASFGKSCRFCGNGGLQTSNLHAHHLVDSVLINPMPRDVNKAVMLKGCPELAAKVLKIDVFQVKMVFFQRERRDINHWNHWASHRCARLRTTCCLKNWIVFILNRSAADVHKRRVSKPSDKMC